MMGDSTSMAAATVGLAPVRSDSAMLMAIIERAAFNQEFDLERIEKLIDLKQRWDNDAALRAYSVAMVEFKKNPPKLTKDKHVKFTNRAGTVTEYDHASHYEVTTKIADALARHGFSHSWSMSQEQNKITVRCTLRHALGHSESVELFAQYDESGGKNLIQAIASANSYLQRYALLAVTGLSTSDIPDDDGKTAQAPPPEINPDVWISLSDAVHDGTDALATAWANVSNDTRRLIVTHYAQRWNDLKAAALAAKRE